MEIFLFPILCFDLIAKISLKKAEIDSIFDYIGENCWSE